MMKNLTEVLCNTRITQSRTITEMQAKSTQLRIYPSFTEIRQNYDAPKVSSLRMQT